MIEWSTCRCARRTAAGDVILGKGRHLAFDEVFFAADWLVGNQSLGHQEPVGRDAQTGMVVELQVNRATYPLFDTDSF